MTQYQDLKDERVIITGGAMGIGRGAALAFAKQGAKVVIIDQAADAIADTLEEAAHHPGHVSGVQADLRQRPASDAAMQEAITRLGGVDIAVNNAGVTQPPAPLHEQNDDLYDYVMDLNVKAVWRDMRIQLRDMLPRGDGAIINIASVAGLKGTPGLATYGTSKYALIGLTKSAALDYAKSGVRINAVAPGSVLTPMIDKFIEMSGNQDAIEQIRAAHPIGRSGEVDEVVNAILFLASPSTTFVIGETITVDGGYAA
ncbi:MAG: glucose 1-dehydrogenase [Pseudomonadota bacterium]